jgi:uncharacterized protein YkwD
LREIAGKPPVVRSIVRFVPKWIAPRIVLGLILTLVGVLALLFLPPLFGGGGDKPRVATNPGEDGARAGACPTALSPAAVRCEINAIRVANGLRPVGAAKALTAAAKRHSADMVRRHYFAHVSPSGQTVTDRVKRAGYLKGARRHKIGENIAWGSGSAASPAAIVRAWMNSPPHRKIILTPDFRDAGIGIARGAPRGGGGATYTLDVGIRR